MDVRFSVLWVIAGAGAVTVLPRVLPLMLLSRLTLPLWLVHWLGYVPIAVLSALLAQSALLVNGHVQLSPHNLSALAVLPTLLLAVYTRSLIWTVLGGMAAMALLRLLVG